MPPEILHLFLTDDGRCHNCKKSGNLVKNCKVRRKHREELKRRKIAAALRRGSSAGEAAGATGKARDVACNLQVLAI